MTCRLIAGFEDFPGTISDARMGAAGYYWFSNGDVMPTPVTGRFGYGNALHCTAGGFSVPAMQMIRMLGVEVSDGVFGFAYKWEPTNSGYVYVSFFDALNYTNCFTVEFTALGIIAVWQGMPRSGTRLIESAPGSFQQSQWFYCEIKAHIDSTSGSVEIRVNTQTVINLVSANTNGGGRGKVDAVSFGGAQSGFNQNYEFYIDDMYFNDTSGSVNNNFLGNVRVKSQFASGAGSSTQFAIGGSAPAATNWQSVLNTLLDDSKFVYDATVGDKDLYTVQAIVNSPLVHAVQVSGGYRMDDSTQRIAHNVLKVGATTVEGGDHYINQTYTMYRDIWELNPDTGIGWTGADVNGIQIGPKVAG